MDGFESKEEEPSLAAWKRWVQGLYVAFVANKKVQDQVAEWTIQFIEDLSEENVPDGAVPALVARTGVNVDRNQAMAALALYPERRRLKPDFVQGMFVFYLKGEMVKEESTGP